MTAVNALFHFQRIIWQIVVNNERRVFQIKALCAVVGGDQDLAVQLEIADSAIISAAVVDIRFVSLGQQLDKHFLRFHTFGEDNRFFIRARSFH